MRINLLYIKLLTFLRLLYFYGVQGVFTFLNLYFGDGLAEVKIPNSEKKVFIRRGTSDTAVFSAIYAFNEFKYDFRVPEQGVVLDCGANIGISTAYFAEKYPRALIIAIEPNTANFDLLERNTQSYKNVKCFHAGVWSESCQLYLQNPITEGWSFRYTDSENKDISIESVEALSVEDLTQKCDIDFIDLMKIDIEGAEKVLFCKGSSRWVSKVGTYIVELHDAVVPGCSSAFYRAIHGIEFTQSILGEKVVIRLNPN